MNPYLAIGFLLWSIALGGGAFVFGTHVQHNADIADQQTERENDAEILRIKNRKGVAAGVRTEKAQARNDQFFQKLRADYESDKKQHPAAGCVLDPVSLRRWNEANAGADGDAASEPAAGVRPGADAQGR
ncbi:hypothetical protein [Noviherbaspirillum sp. ST 5-3]|uniref:hypothetical protein n=1 Tax=Noviherbaspirillum sp. ST 5-3 TaxID=3349878 RepID=UPI003916CDCF